MKKCEKCENCPFYERANGVCFFPGDCTLPEDNELLKLMRKTKLSSLYGKLCDDSAEEAQKEIRQC